MNFRTLLWTFMFIVFYYTSFLVNNVAPVSAIVSWLLVKCKTSTVSVMYRSGVHPSVRLSVPSFLSYLNRACGAYSTWLIRGQHATRPACISVWMLRRWTYATCLTDCSLSLCCALWHFSPTVVAVRLMLWIVCLCVYRPNANVLLWLNAWRGRVGF